MSKEGRQRHSEALGYFTTAQIVGVLRVGHRERAPLAPLSIVTNHLSISSKNSEKEVRMKDKSNYTYYSICLFNNFDCTGFFLFVYLINIMNRSCANRKQVLWTSNLTNQMQAPPLSRCCPKAQVVRVHSRPMHLGTRVDFEVRQGVEG